MSFDAAGLGAAIAAHGPVVRVVVAEVRGSAPRGVGAAMLVWASGQSGTIGGGTLEYSAARQARALLDAGSDRHFERAILGPDMGQCCGGAVALLWERFETLPALGAVYARKVEEGADPAPDETAPRAGAPIDAPADSPTDASVPPGAPRASDSTDTPTAPPTDTPTGAPLPGLAGGWFREPVSPPPVPVWIWGAGHVGRAIAAVLAPLPGLAVTLVDTAPDRFPTPLPAAVTPRVAPRPAAAVGDAPGAAHHFVLTYSHEFDLALCDALLSHGFAGAGLIGSATKWARFRSRLGQMGHDPAAIDRIRCPIGDPSLGKDPQAIAIGVAHALIMDMAKKQALGRVAG